MAAARTVQSLQQFLSSYRVEKGHEHTHTSLGRPTGAFYLPSSSHDAFLRFYKAAFERGEDLFLTEKHRHIGPVVVDLDFRYVPTAEEMASLAPTVAVIAATDEGDARDSMMATSSSSSSAGVQQQQQPQQHRQQPHELRRRHAGAVDDVVNAYCLAVAALVETPPEFDVYVTEKRAPSLFKGMLKDGLHLTMPDIVTRPALQLLLRRDVLPAMGVVLAPLHLSNRIEDVVDEAVIERNNWMMYGSKKQGGESYAVTRRYRYSVADGRAVLTAAGHALDPRSTHYIELLSIRNKYDELRVREAEQDRADAFISRIEEDRKRREAVQLVLSSSPNTTTNTCDDLDGVRRLVEILDVRRVESYDEWVRLGWCLRNIDHRLLEAWAEISKRSSKYVEGECPRLWHSMRIGGLGLGTLHMWARQDAPDRYRELLRLDLVALIKASANGTHYDVARVVHHLYRYEYVCCNIRCSTWYEFKSHRYRECDSAYSLRMRLSTDVYKEYMNVVAQIAQRARSLADDDGHQDEDAQKACEVQIKKLTDLATKLKVRKFKEDVLKECELQFYQERFEDRLNSDVNLLGFENGVYDLKLHEFREGRPDDMISFSTGINYVPHPEDHPVVKDVMRFWESVHPCREIREYVLMTLASCLSGIIREERFHIWTGSGSNGKSLSVSLFEKTLGQYCCKFPVTLLTQKRAMSNSATPEIARAKGRRFAVLQEPSEDERLNVGQLKELSGGDTVQTRELFKAPCEWRPQFKLFLLCNQLPNVPSDDGGTWRRIRVVEFGSKFVENPSPERPNEFPMDMELSGKLESWKEHFMSILIRYYKSYTSRVLDEPSQVVQCTRDYQRTNDHLADFVDSCVEKACAGDTQQDLTLDEAFKELKDWVKRDNVPIKVSKKGGIQKYLERALGRGQVPDAKGKSTVWRGWRLRDMFSVAADVL